ncbi:TauD/TfdA family dioxygenase [Nostoc sp. UIC 10890]
MYSIEIENLIIRVKSVLEMPVSKEAEMANKFNEFGFVILEHEPSATPKNNLLKLSDYFGTIIQHEHSDSQGIVPISPVDSYPEYVNTTTTDLSLHTDGAFTITPPKVMAMQCQIAAANGGFTKLIDGKLVYEHLKRTNPVGLLTLFNPNAITVKRDNKKATKPIFEEHHAGLIVRFRADNAAHVSVESKSFAAFKSFENFVNNPDNQVIFKLAQNQIIIVDNTRVLHGRTAFCKQEYRLLNRLWFDGQSNIINLKFGISIAQKNLSLFAKKYQPSQINIGSDISQSTQLKFKAT